MGERDVTNLFGERISNPHEEPGLWGAYISKQIQERTEDEPQPHVRYHHQGHLFNPEYNGVPQEQRKLF